MGTLLIISVILLLAYFIAACVKLGGLPHSVYSLATAFDYPWRVFWFVAIWGGAALAAPALIEYTPADYQFLTYIALASAVVFGMCARLDEKVDKIITRIAGWLCLFAAIICVVLSLTSKL